MPEPPTPLVLGPPVVDAEAEYVPPRQPRALTFSDTVLESVLDRAGMVVRDVLASRNDQVPLRTEVPDSDPILDVLDSAVAALGTGGDLSPLNNELAKLLVNQEERAKLVSGLVAAHDRSRLVKYLRARSVLENALLRAVSERELTSTQTLAFYKLVVDESATLTADARAGASNVNDVVGLLAKANYATQQSDAALKKKFEQTTPQGREIVRRVIQKLQKALPPE